MSLNKEYAVVAFVDDPRERLNLDFVPVDWVRYDTKKKHLVVPFLPNFSQTNLRILSSAVKSESKPPDTWPTYPIEIQGYTNTFEQAEKRIRQLETQYYAHLTVQPREKPQHQSDAGDMLKAAVSTESSLPPKMKLTDNALNGEQNGDIAMSIYDAELRKIIEKRRIQSDGKSEPLKYDPWSRKGFVYTSSECSDDEMSFEEKFVVVKFVPSPKKGLFITIVPADWVYYDTKKKHLVTPFVPNCSMKNYKMLSSVAIFGSKPPDTWQTFRIEILEYVNNCVEASKRLRQMNTQQYALSADNGEYAEKKITEGEGEVASSTENPQLGDAESMQASFTKPRCEDSDNIKDIIRAYHRNVCAQLSEIRKEIADLKILQTEQSSMIVGASSKPLKGVKTIDMYIRNYKHGQLPYKTMEEFEIFDKKLKAQNSFRKEIMGALSLLISPDPTCIITSVRSIIHIFMKRALVLQFTAAKKCDNKKVMKSDTTFYACLRDAFMLKLGSKSIEEKDITCALGTVIRTAGNWEDHLQDRKKQ